MHMAERKIAYYTNEDLINKTDNELVASAKNGNEEALECLFNKYKEENLDIFDIYRLSEMYYPNENIDNPLSVTELEVNTKLIIKGTGVTKNSI